jgi:Fur family peroxide stress response transcriptional regulator
MMEKTNTYRNSKQRRRVLEVLRSTDRHPTANWIYDQLRGEFPSLSLGTVYRNLGILQEQGLAVRIASGSTFDRFDAVVIPHPHFRCLSCGNVYDIKGSDLFPIMKPGDHYSGHMIESMFIEYRGICASCIEDGKHMN